MINFLNRVIWSFREIAVSTRRHPGAALVSLLTVAVSMSVLGFFLVILMNVGQLLHSVQGSMELVVFLEDGISETQRLQLTARAERHIYTREVHYISKEEARQEFCQDEESRALFANLEDNPLPASLQVKLVEGMTGRENIEKLVRYLEGLDGVEEVPYREELGKLFGLSNFAWWFSLVVGLLLFLATLVVVSSTISYSLAGRGRDVEILGLVGAARGYIAGPFLLEGLCLGLLGSLLAVLVVSFAWEGLAAHLYASFNLEVVPFSRLLGLAITGLGLAVGLLSARVSLNKLSSGRSE
jgi:cell division transport system permease protein